jgi:hypothetical protein
MSPFIPFLLIFSLLAAASLDAESPLVVQSPAVEASSPDSRLRQLEGIYQQQLRTRHIPLLGKYLTDLQQSARLNNTPALQEEIRRVQELISTGGVIDLAAAARELNPASEATTTVPRMPAPGKPRRAPITLTPSFAQSILPQPEGSASPVSAKIGQMSWRIDHLPAGSYDFVLHFSSLTADTSVPLYIEFAGQKLELNLTSSQATKDARTFRLLRLGQMKFDQDINGSTLTLNAGSAETPGLLVRNLVIARARE